MRTAELFVGVLGASSLTYAELTWTQTLPDWVGAHVRMLGWMGKCPKLLLLGPRDQGFDVLKPFGEVV